LRDLTATASYTYAGQRLKAGDTFTATDSDARLLTIIGKAKVSVAAVQKKQSAKKQAAQKKPPAEKTYARRDLRAEG
jgi:hypothetical protein